MGYYKEYYESAVKEKLKAKREEKKRLHLLSLDCDPLKEKLCPCCDTVKPLEAFSHTPTTKSKLRSHCRVCNSTNAKESYRKNKQNKQSLL